MRQRVLGFISQWWKQVLTLIVLLGGLGVATWELLESDANQREHNRNLFRNQCIEVADKLKRQVETSVSSLYAMASMIEIDGGKFLEEHFTPIAETILLRYKGITNFDIAPYAVVKTKVPAKGNEGAIGHAMFSDPNRIEATARTVREQKALLDGPIRLKQTGGIGVIARFPVFTAFSKQFIPDIREWWPDWSHSCCNTSMPLPGYGAESFPGPVKNGNQTYFYGLVEYVSKLPNLTADLNVPLLEESMTFQFRNTNPHPTMSDSPVFFHSSDIQADTVLDDPEIVLISIPEINVEWEFLAVPKDGWPGPSIIYILLIAGIFGGLVAAGLAYFLIRRLIRLSGSSKLLEEQLEKQREETIRKAWYAVEELAAPMVLISVKLFYDMGTLTSAEELRNAGKVIILDTLAQVQAFRQTRWIIFFSHQWLGYAFPDKDNLHYSTMCGVIPSIMSALPHKDTTPSVDTTYIWVDYGSISQINRSVQALCINSLPLFASEADAFIMITPEVKHINTHLPCNFETYSQRGWCRAEVLCKVCASGVSNMYIAKNPFQLEPLTMQKFKELSLSVFEGKFTCCALRHPDGSQCDKQKLMSPILGMYLALSEDMQGTEAAGVDKDLDSAKVEEGAAVKNPDNAKAAVFEYLTEKQHLFFPQSTKYLMEKKEVEQELFGDVVTKSISFESGVSRVVSRKSTGNLSHSGSSDTGIPSACPIELGANAL